MYPSALSGAEEREERIEKKEREEKNEKKRKEIKERSVSAVSGVCTADVSALSGAEEKEERIEKNERGGENERIERIEKNEKNERNWNTESGVGGMSAVSGGGEKNERIEKNEKNERNKRNESAVRDVGAVSGGSERTLRLRGSGDTAREAARGRAGHVELQGGSSGTIPVFTQDEILIHPNHGNQEVPRCLEPSDHSDDLRIRLSGTERSSKGPKIRPTLDEAGIVSSTEIEGRRKEFERCREWDPGETNREQLGQPKGQEQLLYLAGVDCLGEVLAVAPPLDFETVGLSTTATGTRMPAVFKAPEQGVNPLYNSERPKIHSGERDPKAMSEKRSEGEEVLDMRLATRLEAANQRLRASSAEHALELETEAISQDATARKAIRTEDMDPGSTESEEPLPARLDP